MNKQQWLECVRNRMQGQGLPPAYQRRFMEELADHWEDLAREHVTEEGMDTDGHVEVQNVQQRLGEPQQLAAAAVTAYRRRSFLGRHPLATFGVFAAAPLLLAALSSLTITGLVFFCDAWDALGWNAPWHNALWLPTAESVLLVGLRLLTIVVPSVLATLVYCLLTRRLAIGRQWLILSSVLMGALAVLPMWSVKLSEIRGESWLRVGIWSPGPRWWHWCPPHDFLSLVQLAVPLLIACWFMQHSRMRERVNDDSLQAMG